MWAREERRTKARTEGKGMGGFDGDCTWRLRGSGSLVVDDREDIFGVLMGKEFRGGEDRC